MEARDRPGGARVVTPPYLARPLSLSPFRAMSLAPSRIGDPASARAFGRPYRAVAQRLLDWERRGQVSRETRPAVYLHEYTAAGLTVRGLVGALDVARRAERPEDRAVWPHEGIHTAQVRDLAKRMARMEVNPAPILLVHDGPDTVRDLVSRVCRAEPERAFRDRAEQQHRLWPIRDAEHLALLDRELAGARALIADGHHRYAAYLRLQEKHPGTAWDRGLAMLVDQMDTPLFLGAIHRVLRSVGIEDVIAAARAGGAEVRRVERGAALDMLGQHSLVLTDASTWAGVTPRAHQGRAVVEWLQEDLVAALPHYPDIGYHHTVDAAVAALGQGGTAVLLPAPPFGQIRDIVTAGRLLPQKATSFQPKPSVGVLMRSLRDG